MSDIKVQTENIYLKIDFFIVLTEKQNRYILLHSNSICIPLMYREDYYWLKLVENVV